VLIKFFHFQQYCYRPKIGCHILFKTNDSQRNFWLLRGQDICMGGFSMINVRNMKSAAIASHTSHAGTAHGWARRAFRAYSNAVYLIPIVPAEYAIRRECLWNQRHSRSQN
jgi:hypothetical protein